MSSSAKSETRRTLEPSSKSWPSSMEKTSGLDRWVARVLFGLAALCLALGVFVWRVLLSEIPHDDGNPHPASVRNSVPRSKE